MMMMMNTESKEKTKLTSVNCCRLHVKYRSGNVLIDFFSLEREREEEVVGNL